jgi:hypothetical protein
MSTFYYIAHKLLIRDIALKEDITPSNISDFNTNKYINHILKQTSGIEHVNFIKTIFILSHKSKFNGLQTNYINTVFTTDNDRELFLCFFSNIQRTYWMLTRFAIFIKKIKYKLNVNHDMFLTPISIKQKNVYIHYENNHIYLFTVQDLSRIITTAICNSPQFYSEPLLPKNPYSGVTFSNTDLYNMYFRMKDSLITVPPVMYAYFLSNFNIDTFKNNNQVLIRNVYINQFVKNEDQDEIVEYIYDMLAPFTRLKIDTEFPESVLVDTFKDVLVNYLRYKYSHDTSRRSYNYMCVRKRIHEILKSTPGFGRKIFSFVKNKKYVSFITIGGNTDKKLIQEQPIFSRVVLNNNDVSNNMITNNIDVSNNATIHVISDSLQIDSIVRTRIDEMINSIQRNEPTINYSIIPISTCECGYEYECHCENECICEYECNCDSLTLFDSDDDIEEDESMYDP